MPTYDYKCRECSQTASLITSIRENLSVPICAKCKTEMVRNYGLGAVTFKGSGFYATDKGKK